MEFPKGIGLRPPWWQRLLFGAEQFAILYFFRAHVKHARGDLDGALPDINEAIRLNPALARGYRLRAQIRVHGLDYEGARTDMEKSLALEPDDPGAEKALALLRETAERTEAWTAALRAFDEYEQVFHHSFAMTPIGGRIRPSSNQDGNPDDKNGHGP